MANTENGSELRTVSAGESQLRLQTLVRLRWLGILGQVVAIGVVALILKFDFPIGWCLFFVAGSAWLNVYLAVRFPSRHRLSPPLATALLAYDVVQLAALLYLTGGIENPFAMLIVAPVTVSAATLPPANTIILGVLAVVAATILTAFSMPLPWYAGVNLDHPALYDGGLLIAVVCSMAFIAFYAWRLTRESREMSAALTATELVLAREQKLHALDGLAAAAAHELGTPLSTIALVSKELERQVPADDPMREDFVLLHQQALRCREILQKLTRSPSEQDPLHASLTVQELLAEAAAPYKGGKTPIYTFARPAAGTEGDARREPEATRRPGILYGLGNILENAVDFARSRVDFSAEWGQNSVTVVIADDGPGFKPELIETLGEPYVSTRSSPSKRRNSRAGGLGLGFFIAKTLLERSGARLSLDNKPAPQTGAVVRIEWPRTAFAAEIGSIGQRTTGSGTGSKAEAGFNASRPPPPAEAEVYDR